MTNGIPYPVLIAGAGGMLGWDLTRVFGEAVGPERVFAVPHLSLDITNEGSIAAALKRYQPRVILNSAAYTSVDGAESERDAAYRINVVGPRMLAKVAGDFGIKLVHFSTDQVFDGKSDRPRTEDERPNPCNYYAETKLQGEREAMRAPEALVLRVQWLYGQRKDRFTTLRGKETFTPFSDQFGSPTWTKVIADTLLDLLDRDVSGLYHFAHDDHASWLEVFQFVKDELGLSVKLLPKKTAEVRLPAKRPLFSVLSNKKLCQALGRDGLGSWKPPMQAFFRAVLD